MTKLKISRRSEIGAFLALDVLKAANARADGGDDVLHMEVGEPSARPPTAVIEEAQRVLRDGLTGYTEALGLAPLRARIAADYKAQFGLEIEPDRVAVTTGSSAGFILAFLAAFDPGDRVLIVEPGYPAYPKLLSALGLEPVVVEGGPDQGFKLTPQALERALRDQGAVDGVLIASPANPTGTMLDADELRAICDFCKDAGIRLISDEIYQRITYTRTAATALSFCDQAIVINSFSKYHCMTGWRIGWMVVPQSLVRAIECLAQSIFISPPSVAQHAALVALDGSRELDRHVAQYARNRAHLLAAFDRIGIDRRAPADGAFYLYADVSDFTNDSLAFCHKMLAETGVAATPGVDFDSHSGHRFVRFSFAGHAADIEGAAQRLVDWLAS